MSRFRSAVMIAFMGVGLGSCAMMGNSAPTTYDLIAPRSFAGQVKPSRIQLVVAEPTAVRALNSERIMVRPSAEKVSYYQGAVWSDRLPKLLQARMVEAFENSGAVKAVATSSDRIEGDLTLQTVVRSFQIDVGEGAPSAQIDLFAKLVDGRQGKIVASKSFSSRVQADKDTPAGGVVAMNQALTVTLQDVVTWVGTRR